MAKIKLTPWFPKDVKPVRVGFYQRKYQFKNLVDIPDYWNGEKWLLVDKYGYMTDIIVNREWRGIAR